jgi:hypothetical protein
MRFIWSLCLLPAVVLIAVPLPSQNVNPMHPQEIDLQKPASPDEMRARVANIQLQNDAKELAGLCASIPGDMDAIKQGLLSPAVLEKLKRVEKLSKHVREQLTRTTP